MEKTYNSNLSGVKESAEIKKPAFVFTDEKEDPNDPSKRRYTLFLWFIDGYDQEKTFEFITGQANVRNFVVENADIIDFNKSLISSWKEKPEGEHGFVLLLDFMIYLEKLIAEDDEGNQEKLYNDGFNIEDFLASQHQLIELAEEESVNYMNDVRLAYHRTKMIDINHIEEREDL